jgi:hypothetical protein
MDAVRWMLADGCSRRGAEVALGVRPVAGDVSVTVDEDVVAVAVELAQASPVAARSIISASTVRNSMTVYCPSHP